MSNSLNVQICDSLLNVQGFFTESIKKVVYNKQPQIHFNLRKLGHACCPQCGMRLKTHDIRTRYLKHSSILLTPVILVLNLRRTKCPVCGILTEKQDIAEVNKQHTKQFEEEVLEYTRELSNKATVKLLGTTISTVYRIDKIGLENLDKSLISKTPKTTKLSLDETSYKKHHNYTTVLTNQEDGKIIDISKGKSKNSAIELLSKYDKHGKFNHLDTIAIDFSQSYISAVSDFYADHYIVFDKFHFSRIVNRKMEIVRRLIQKELPEEERYDMKKHVRWLILRRQKNFSQHHTKRLQELMLVNQDLYKAYLIKEDLLSIFDEELEANDAEERFTVWCRMVNDTNFIPFKQLAIQIKKRLSLLLNWFKYRVSNAKAEAINNKIKTIIKMAYGYKDFDYFRLKVLQRCGYLME